MKILQIGNVWINVRKISAIWTEEKKIFVQVEGLKVNTAEYTDEAALSKDVGTVLQALNDHLTPPMPSHTVGYAINSDKDQVSGDVCLGDPEACRGRGISITPNASDNG